LTRTHWTEGSEGKRKKRRDEGKGRKGRNQGREEGKIRETGHDIHIVKFYRRGKGRGEREEGREGRGRGEKKRE
jgi:hypothetical protein